MMYIGKFNNVGMSSDWRSNDMVMYSMALNLKVLPLIPF